MQERKGCCSDAQIIMASSIQYSYIGKLLLVKTKGD